jgi:hypothetical protein
MLAAVQVLTDTDAVPDNAAFAMAAAWGHSVNGTFETIEGQLALALDDLERFVVVVAANITLRHGRCSLHAHRPTEVTAGVIEDPERRLEQ